MAAPASDSYSGEDRDPRSRGKARLYTVTPRMISALGREATRNIIRFQSLWGVRGGGGGGAKSQQSICKPQALEE